MLCHKPPQIIKASPAELSISHHYSDGLGGSSLSVVSSEAPPLEAAFSGELGRDTGAPSMWLLSHRIGWTSSQHVGWIPRGLKEMWKVFVQALAHYLHPLRRGTAGSLSLLASNCPTPGASPTGPPCLFTTTPEA